MSISDKLVQIVSNLQRVFDAGRDSIKLEEKTVCKNRNGWYYPNVDEGYDGIGSLQIQVNTPQDNYEAGKKAEYDAFWDEIQDYGKRNHYSSAFAYWASEYIHPKYKAIPKTVNGVGSMFYGCPNLLKVEKDYVDFSQKESGTTTQHGYYYTFSGCNSLEEIEDIGFQATAIDTTGSQTVYYQTFGYCYRLHTIAVIRSNEKTGFTNAFTQCKSLQNITFEGVIGQDINFKDCTLLTHESLMSIINALQQYNGDGKTHTVTLGQANISKLSEQEIAFATQKGWTIA